ncbi:hypothetical protein HZS_5330 [Henneguya salminicola]|nr:hypothetical protein HZS_5330 [Henneguya salminicola]
MFAAFAFIQEENIIQAYKSTYNKIEDEHITFAHLKGKIYYNILKFMASLHRKLSNVDVMIDIIHM